ncbi:MAG TPA: MmcQ/YjbR family DNA-binding protein [Bacteroidia bacterium]|jgi:predicted DNA-binding protein (MmcQ/YjbR family)|nr:MmcQ/YjbR family DNA-binding protein [Bacteroidia bacterium]HRG52525.1 MmcQ/YjbR family DNA-binding protein [Bacteroidia bacterium]
MNIEELRNYCLSKKGVTEDLPFGPDTLVFKVMDKIFLLTGMGRPLQFNVKCDPEKAVVLRDQYSCVKPGYHMNKKYWNTVTVDGSVSAKQLQEWINHSYQQVVVGLPKIKQKELQVEGEK